MMKKHPSIDEQAKLAAEALHAKFVKQVKEMNQKDNPSRSMLKQAEYFLEKIREYYQNDPECKYYLWTFIWSARAVLDYLYKHYKFDSNWKSDKELNFLREIRELTIHRIQAPTETTATNGIAMGVDLINAGERPPDQASKPDCSPPKERNSSCKVGWEFLKSYKPVGEQKKIRFPNNSDPDVLNFCERQLAKIIKLVEDCEQKNEQEAK